MRKKSFIVLLGVIFFNFSYAQTVLNADGEGDTYELINSVLAPDGNVVEVPDCGHEEFGRHIDEVYDSVLQMYVFRFHMHVTPDNDRCINFDRQRTEIKTYDKSPDSTLGVYGETHEYKWKFKLDSGFQSSSSFTHIHQLKAVGGSYESMPLITLTTRVGSPDKLELRYAAAASQSTITKVDLTPIKGTWVQATEKVTFGDPGDYSVKLVKIETDEVLFEYSSTTKKMWKDGASFIRPKWGLYRSLDNSVRLRDEMLFFADFYIKETPAVVEKDTIKPTLDLTTVAEEPVTDRFELSITFSEKVNGFLESDLSVTNGLVQEGSLATSDSVVFTSVIVPEASGNVIINVEAGVASDEAGNTNEAAETFSVIADIANAINNTLEDALQLYPNPTSGVLNISTSNNTEFIDIELFDQSGKLLLSQVDNNKMISLDLIDYNTGLYLIHIKTSNQEAYRKVIIK